MMINKNAVAKFISKHDNVMFLTCWGFTFWTTLIAVMMLLSIDSFSFVWLLCFTCMSVSVGLSCYMLGGEGVRKVTGVSWFEKKFNIDLTEE